MKLKIFFSAVTFIFTIVYYLLYFGIFFKSEQNCKIYLKSHHQFYTYFDGQKYPKFLPIYENDAINFKCLNSTGSKKPKTILLWTKFKGLPFLPNLEEIIMNSHTSNVLEDFNCPVSNCKLTFDRNKLNESDMVLFHLRNKLEKHPESRRANQHWVHVIYESPVHCKNCVDKRVTYNLSSTYTRDSDFTSIYWSDSGLYWTQPDQRRNPQIIRDIYMLKNPDFLAATLISDFFEQRQNYVTELSRFMSLEIYGKQGSFKCPDESVNIDCRKFISDKYMFFLVFENSVCRDYITEKFFNTLKFNVVPVVMGGGDYSYYIPKSGFINALDFQSPADLATFLVGLSKDKDAYNSYFKWKDYIGYRKPVAQAFLCEMCIKLLLEEAGGVVEHKVLENMEGRFSMAENCRGQKATVVTRFEYLLGNYLNQSEVESPE